MNKEKVVVLTARNSEGMMDCHGIRGVFSNATALSAYLGRGWGIIAPNGEDLPVNGRHEFNDGTCFVWQGYTVDGNMDLEW